MKHSLLVMTVSLFFAGMNSAHAGLRDYWDYATYGVLGQSYRWGGPPQPQYVDYGPAPATTVVQQATTPWVNTDVIRPESCAIIVSVSASHRGATEKALLEKGFDPILVDQAQQASQEDNWRYTSKIPFVRVRASACQNEPHDPTCTVITGSFVEPRAHKTPEIFKTKIANAKNKTPDELYGEFPKCIEQSAVQANLTKLKETKCNSGEFAELHEILLTQYGSTRNDREKVRISQGLRAFNRNCAMTASQPAPSMPNNRNSTKFGNAQSPNSIVTKK